MVTILIFLRNRWILLFWSVPLIKLFLVLLQCLNERDTVRERCNIPPSSSLGNPGGSFLLQIELAISRTIRFVSFFDPVMAIASMQASTVGVTIRYRTSSSASASNCIHASHKNNNTMPMRDVILCHFCKMSLTVVYAVAHSYLLYTLVHT